MSELELRADQAERLVRLFVARLRAGPASAPWEGERETLFTRRVVRPIIERFVTACGISGLVVAGDGGAPVLPVSSVGLSFYPDVTIRFHAQMLFALEVKYLASEQRQNSLTTALGQASIYRQNGYLFGGVFLIDLAGTLSEADVGRATVELERANAIHLIVRKPLRGALQFHPSSSPPGNAAAAA
jgi:hypothetical protein